MAKIRTGLMGRLSQKSHEELLNLLEQLVQRQPDIASLVELLMELPLAPASQEKQRPGRSRERTIDPSAIRSQVTSAFYNAGEGWGAAGRAAAELDRLCDIGKSFAEAGQWANAQVTNVTPRPSFCVMIFLMGIKTMFLPTKNLEVISYEDFSIAQANRRGLTGGSKMMSKFTDIELEYLKTQRLGRLATINKNGEPQVAPVTFLYNAELDTIDIGGLHNAESQKFRNVALNGLTSFVIDDVLPPFQPRGIEIRGRAQALPDGGQRISPNFSPALIRLTPGRIISWNLDPAQTHLARNV